MGDKQFTPTGFSAISRALSLATRPVHDGVYRAIEPEGFAASQASTLPGSVIR